MERIFELKNVIKISFCRNKETKKEHPASVPFQIGGNTLSWILKSIWYRREIRPKIYYQLNTKEQLTKVNRSVLRERKRTLQMSM